MPKPEAVEAATVVGEDGNVQNVDFKNLTAEEAFQVLGVSIMSNHFARLLKRVNCPSIHTGSGKDGPG